MHKELSEKEQKMLNHIRKKRQARPEHIKEKIRKSCQKYWQEVKELEQLTGEK